MDTDALIARLAEEARGAPQTRGALALGAPLAAAVTLGAVLSAALTAAVLGWRPDLLAALGAPAVLFKFALAAGLALAGSALALRLARPGAPVWSAWWLAPLGAVALVGLALALGSGERAAEVLRGRDAWFCLTSIFTLSAPALALALAALRRGAATRPTLAGAAAGLAAGAAGALGYAFYCPIDSALFVCVWYAAAIGLAAGLGALFGRAALAW